MICFFEGAVMMRFATFLLAFSNFLVAQNIPFAGTSWKLNSEKSKGPTPACLALEKGILQLPREIYTGSPSDKPVRPLPAKCAIVYKFDFSPDGRTLTLTQPQLDASFKTVFDKQ
jgi:hypothetical protein